MVETIDAVVVEFVALVVVATVLVEEIVGTVELLVVDTTLEALEEGSVVVLVVEVGREGIAGNRLIISPGATR